MTSSETLLQQIGTNTAQELHEWDLYETPERAYDYAKKSYRFNDGDFQHFKAGVIRYFATLQQQKIV